MPLNQPLVSLLTSRADAADRLVAFGSAPGSERRRSHLLADVGALAVRLGSKRGASWLVEAEDAYRVAVALLAAAANGCRVVLPPNLQPGTLAELRSRCDAVLTDGAPAAKDGPDILDPLEPGSRVAAAATVADIDRDAPLVDLYTSGTSGPGKLVTKALRHLEDEVVELERRFGADIDGDAVVLATVPAHHLYGLLFRVLWPLAAGRAFCRASFLLPDELLARTGQACGAVIVSSPAHLRHLAASPRLAEQAPVIRAVFSSGGPLETKTALDLEAALGDAPIEIFGSTETGGVASRRATREEPAPLWTPFEPVRLAVSGDGRLEVTSPFVTPPIGGEGGATWCMGDSVSLEAGRFRLLGRSDRIAKVGEKTLSLPEIELALAAHEAVESAVVGSYRERGNQRLGALVVLSAAGKRKLASVGRRALQAELAEHLATRWDRVALPRRWRFREFLAVDARGKFAHDAFEAELARPADEVREPLLVGEEREGDEVVMRFVVPRDLAYLDGHYDAFPLVPGAVQILWVLAATGRLLDRSVSAQRMEAIKFKSVLRPGQEFAMRLRIHEEDGHEDGTRVAFTLAGDGRVFSSGRLTLFS